MKILSPSKVQQEWLNEHLACAGPHTHCEHWFKNENDCCYCGKLKDKVEVGEKL